MSPPRQCDACRYASAIADGPAGAFKEDVADAWALGVEIGALAKKERVYCERHAEMVAEFVTKAEEERAARAVGGINVQAMIGDAVPCEACDYAAGVETGFDLDDEAGPRAVASQAWSDGFAAAASRFARVVKEGGDIGAVFCRAHSTALKDALAAAGFILK